MGIIAFIFEPKGIGNCSNGGISAKANAVCVVNAEGPFEPSDALPAVEVINHPASTRFDPIAIPVDAKPEGSYGPMSGGCMISSHDAQWAEHLRSLGHGGVTTVSLHDRYETAKQYARYSS